MSKRPGDPSLEDDAPPAKQIDTGQNTVMPSQAPVSWQLVDEDQLPERKELGNLNVLICQDIRSRCKGGIEMHHDYYIVSILDKRCHFIELQQDVMDLSDDVVKQVHDMAKEAHDKGN